MNADNHDYSTSSNKCGGNSKNNDTIITVTTATKNKTKYNNINFNDNENDYVNDHYHYRYPYNVYTQAYICVAIWRNSQGRQTSAGRPTFGQTQRTDSISRR